MKTTTQIRFRANLIEGFGNKHNNKLTCNSFQKRSDRKPIDHLMEIRPNPAMEFINIGVTCCESETSLEEVVVNNVLGTTVYFAKNILTQNSTRISCANWPSGSYFVTVKLSDSSINTDKIVVIK